MKLRLRHSILARTLLITIVISIVFLFLGREIGKTMGSYDQDRRVKQMLESHAAILLELSNVHKIPLKQSLEIVKKAIPPKIGGNYFIIEKSSLTEFLKEKKVTSEDIVSAPIDGDTLLVAVELDRDMPPGPPRDFKGGPPPEFDRETRGPPGGERRGPRGSGPLHGPPPPKFIFIGQAISLGSLLAGMTVSLFILVWFLRRKADEVETVLAQIEAGDLKARIPTETFDELTGLSKKFNRMAGSIEELVGNLRETEESRRLLLEELAHDLRTPVASLKSLTEIIYTKWESLTPKKREEIYGLIMGETVYFEKLLDDLLFMSGLDEPRYKVDFGSHELSVILEELIHIDDRVNLTIEDEARVSGNPILLRRLFLNALSNATRFANEKIQITLKIVDNTAVVTVADDGKGLTPDQLTQFGKRKFSRQWERDAGGHISIGLGSTIMSKIAKVHRATIDVSNGNLGGAEIKITFPLP